MGDDLCTYEEIILFGQISEDIDYDLIVAYIAEASSIIREEAEDESLTRNNIFAKRACVYLVLKMLEDTGIIKRQLMDIASFSDGDFSVTTVGRFGYRIEETLPVTNTDKYNYYLIKLLRNPFDYEVIYDY